MDAQTARQRYRYEPETGLLYHLHRGNGRVQNKPLGYVSNGFRHSEMLGRKRPTAHMHYGELPKGILRRLNGDNLDDRIENLAYVRKQLSVSYVHDGCEVNEYGRLPQEVVTGVYEIRCIHNGRRYIGSAANFSSRWRLHYTQLETGTHHSRHLQRSWNKYGESGFVFRVVEQCDRASIIEREQHYIDTLKPEFNSRPDATSQLGFKFSEESKKKMSEAAKRSRNFKGHKHSEETKRRISESRKGKGNSGWTQERKDRISAANKGRVISAQQRLRISEKLRGHKQSQETINKRMESIKRRRMSGG